MSYCSGFLCLPSDLHQYSNKMQECATGRANQPRVSSGYSSSLVHQPTPWCATMKAAFNNDDWRVSPIYPDVFLKRRLGTREKSSFIPLFTSCLSLNPLLCSLANFSNVDTAKRSICIVQSAFNHFNMETIPGDQATNCPFLIFSLLFLLGFGYVVGLGHVQLATSWEVQGFPEFMIYPEKAPVGKLHRGFLWFCL